MTDKEKIIAEIESRLKRLTDGSVGQRYAYRTLLEFINSLPEEPVSEKLDAAGKEWLKPQLDKSYANYGETKMMELTRFDGYAMLDAIEFGANWKEQQKCRLLEIGGEAAEIRADECHEHLMLIDRLRQNSGKI